MFRVRDLGRDCDDDESHDFVVICDSFPELARWRLACLSASLSDLRTSFSHRHLWVIAGSIEPFPLREGDGAIERGGRIMCRILDKLSGIPTGHSHCLWNLIRACHQLTF